MALLKRASRLFFCLMLLCASTLPARAQNIKLEESHIKAGLLYNFLKYAEWPAEKDTTNIMVCVFGGDPFNGYLSSLEKMTVKLRPIQVRYISAATDIPACHLLFVNAVARDKWPELRRQSLASHVLTISDFDGFVQSGGIIQFAKKDNRIAALLNRTAAQAAGLHISARVLNLVTVANYPVPGGAP